MWKGGSVEFARGTTWTNPTDMVVSIGEFIFSGGIAIKGVEFRARGTNIRRIQFNGRGDGTSDYVVDDCLFDGCAPHFFSDSALANWKRLYTRRNKAYNDDTVSASIAMHIGGDTSSSNGLQDVVCVDNHVESVGTTAIIHMDSVSRRSVTMKDNTAIFTAGSGTLGYGIRTARNQNATGQHTRFIADVRGNKVLSRVGTNTITTGIQINGLDASGSLNAGQYLTGDNIVEEATTRITTTGTAVTAA